MIRRVWYPLVSLCLSVLLGVITFVSPRPVHADTPCTAVANRPTQVGSNDVEFSGHGQCASPVESIVVHVNGFYREINETVPRLLTSTTFKCLDLRTARCPNIGEVKVSHSLVRSCHYYWTNVVIDVEYPGGGVIIPHVADANSTDGPNDPGVFLCGVV